MARKSNNTALNNLCDRLNSVVLDNKLSKTITFVGTTTGAITTHALATVTGVVAVQLFAICSVDVASAGGTVEVGTADTTAGLIAQTTATEIDAYDIWHDNSPDASIELTSVLTHKIVSRNVGYKIAGATLTAGAVTFYLMWTPISADGNVVMA